MNDQADRPDLIPERYVRLLIWLGAVLVGLLIPLQILQTGYLPADDALRHVGKVVSGKSWGEILVLRQGFEQDEHPGWHALLGWVYRCFQPGADGLVTFSVASLFVLWWAALVVPRRRPEAMLAALFIGSLTAAGTFSRVLNGRPFIFAMMICVVLLQLWTSDRPKRIVRVAVTLALLTVSVWMHGSWFLWGIVCVAFALAGQWRKGFVFGLCVLGGTFLAGCLAGRPLGYPVETVRHMFLSFGGHSLDRMLVSEFKPDPGDVVMVGLILLSLVWRVARGNWNASVVCNPIFMLAALGWLLGLKVSRFWTDWGFPAALLWLAMELEAVLEESGPRRAYPRLLLAGFVAAGVFIATVRDVGGRWTDNLTVEHVTPETPNIADWLPQKGGIVYASDMNVFYRTFYKNPRAEWRYILGFEPGIMPEEDLKTLRNIQWNWYAGKAYAPWVEKMRPEDRMILLQGAGSPPSIAGLEWKYVASDTWIGRLPLADFSPAHP